MIREVFEDSALAVVAQVVEVSMHAMVAIASRTFHIVRVGFAWVIGILSQLFYFLHDVRRQWRGFEQSVSSLVSCHICWLFVWPNQSPEPTAVGAGSSAIAVHAASRRWLSFFR